MIRFVNNTNQACKKVCEPIQIIWKNSSLNQYEQFLNEAFGFASGCLCHLHHNNKDHFETDS